MDNRLNDIYYNTGIILTGGSYRDDFAGKDRIMSEQEISKFGKRFATNDIQAYGAPRETFYAKEVQANIDKMRDMQSRGDTGAYGENIKGFERAIQAQKEKLDSFTPAVQAWEYYQKAKSGRAQAGGIIERMQRPTTEDVSPQRTQPSQSTSGGFAESVSSFGQNVQQFGQNVLNYGQRVLSFPKSRQFNPTGFIHTQKLTQ